MTPCRRLPGRAPLAAVAALALAVLLAGCLSLGGTGETAQDPTQAAGAGPGPGVQAPHTKCSRNRTAVAHHPGAQVVEDPDGLVPVPCLSKTGYHSREPTVGIARDGTLFHYPAMSGNNFQPTGVAVSRDGGRTWTAVFPNVSGQETHPISLDPYLYLDQRTGRVFADDLTVPGSCSSLSWSDDQGRTWSHAPAGCTQADHTTIFAGPPVSSDPMGYPNVVYRCAINGGIGTASTMATCKKSLDGGRTWVPTGAPPFVTPADRLPDVCYGATGHGFVDGEGTVYLPKGMCGKPMLAISEDEGRTWTRVRVSDRRMRGHDAGVAADPAGNVYYFFVDEENRLPYLVVSRDGGETWGEPMMVAPPGVNEASQPEMIVGGTGRLAFVYMGTTESPGPPFEGDYSNTTWNAYVGMTADALAQDPVFYSAPVNHPERDAFVRGQCGGIRCQGVQDFMDVRIGPDGTPYGAFVDDCLGPGARCLRYDEAGGIDTHRMGAVGWLAGGPSLWGEDANGRYPD